MCSASPSPTRRAVLGAALAGLATPVLAACTGEDVPDGPPPVPPDVRTADRAAERERELLAAYDAALLIAPQLADRLRPVRSDHAAHLVALAPPAPTAAPTADPSAPPSPTPPPVPPPALPQDPAALLPALAELERRAALAHAGDAVRGGRGIGALLASVSACESSHVVVLS